MKLFINNNFVVMVNSITEASYTTQTYIDDNDLGSRTFYGGQIINDF